MSVLWKNLFQYGLTVLAVLVLILAPMKNSPEEKNLQSVELQNYTGEIAFNEQNLTVTVSGNTSLPNPASRLIINSTNYSSEEKQLTVKLGSRSTLPEGSAVTPVIQTVNYTLKASFSREILEKVLVRGVFRQTTLFRPER